MRNRTVNRSLPVTRSRRRPAVCSPLIIVSQPFLSLLYPSLGDIIALTPTGSTVGRIYPMDFPARRSRSGAQRPHSRPRVAMSPTGPEGPDLPVIRLWMAHYVISTCRRNRACLDDLGSGSAVLFSVPDCGSGVWISCCCSLAYPFAPGYLDAAIRTYWSCGPAILARGCYGRNKAVEMVKRFLRESACHAVAWHNSELLRFSLMNWRQS
jgi:hypothetical protein